ncbi:hypothetical protein E8E13_004904 [Curvularia kusanoi]|uniref:Tautomerase cis-CaaD-like domain-containing protein n=1 Tax=Curvularia kusanoi TaxID=90978 RepID=A0A9P4W7B3_CURKU|nr:hypothetical protein E8E13_004904 [Curvularia kusanoi]
MPLYQIHHSAPLTPSQQTLLAQGITSLHCSTFSAPSAFVNMTFHYNPPVSTPSSTPTTTIYVGGTPHRTNYILGHLRPRRNNAEKLAAVVRGITALWNEHVRSSISASTYTPKDSSAHLDNKAHLDATARLDDPLALHNVFLMEDIVAGAEQGFLLPPAGRDLEWARENMGAFEGRAREGDESMGVLVREYKGKL